MSNNLPERTIQSSILHLSFFLSSFFLHSEGKYENISISETRNKIKKCLGLKRIWIFFHFYIYERFDADHHEIFWFPWWSKIVLMIGFKAIHRANSHRVAEKVKEPTFKIISPGNVRRRRKVWVEWNLKKDYVKIS